MGFHRMHRLHVDLPDVQVVHLAGSPPHTTPMKFLIRWFQKKQREADLKILRPSLRDNADSIAQARLAFFMHAAEDPCWTNYYTSEELLAFTETLS